MPECQQQRCGSVDTHQRKRDGDGEQRPEYPPDDAPRPCAQPVHNGQQVARARDAVLAQAACEALALLCVVLRGAQILDWRCRWRNGSEGGAAGCTIDIGSRVHRRIAGLDGGGIRQDGSALHRAPKSVGDDVLSAERARAAAAAASRSEQHDGWWPHLEVAHARVHGQLVPRNSKQLRVRAHRVLQIANKR